MLVYRDPVGYAVFSTQTEEDPSPGFPVKKDDPSTPAPKLQMRRRRRDGVLPKPPPARGCRGKVRLAPVSHTRSKDNGAGVYEEGQGTRPSGMAASSTTKTAHHKHGRARLPYLCTEYISTGTLLPTFTGGHGKSGCPRGKMRELSGESRVR
ncbi:hypothetical protein BDP81DRAFT_184924 [Colletotrichum phormii]|uniref:Uncharacterized protein n=1 Tax=Colletotrichum phormii TaxID=359342 RepID=A0AAI9ZXA5_9PEZI|nr:uncharacterized protein BDP81DRAFT_184924 [Colletotrichum phormii]KAK1639886.1 hypothetical protein BDP81DRAFT_184924 [Colletotrichum phormii]